MAQYAVLVVETQQRMHDAAVAHVDLRRLDEALAHVGVERRQAAHQEQIRQEVDVAGHGLAVDGQRARQDGHVQDAALPVGPHGPEPPQRLGRHARPQLRDVPLQARPNELLAPLGAVPVALRQEARREAAADPQARSEVAAAFPDVERRQLEIRDASREALARLPQQVRSGGAEEQELPATSPSWMRSSMSTRRISNNPGARCTSSMTTAGTDGGGRRRAVTDGSADHPAITECDSAIAGFARRSPVRRSRPRTPRRCASPG